MSRKAFGAHQIEKRFRLKLPLLEWFEFLHRNLWIYKRVQSVHTVYTHLNFPRVFIIKSTITQALIHTKFLHFICMAEKLNPKKRQLISRKDFIFFFSSSLGERSKWKKEKNVHWSEIVHRSSVCFRWGHQDQRKVETKGNDEGTAKRLKYILSNFFYFITGGWFN